MVAGGLWFRCSIWASAATASSGPNIAMGTIRETSLPFGVRSDTRARLRKDFFAKMDSTAGGKVPSGTALGMTILCPSTCSIHRPSPVTGSHSPCTR